MKKYFVHVLQRVEEAFPPATTKKQLLIDNFIHEIKTIKGDLIIIKE